MTQTDLPQEILGRLDALAAKIGSTAEQAWPVYLSYVRTEALMGCCGPLVLLVIFFVLQGWVRKRLNEDFAGHAILFSLLIGGGIMLATVFEASSKLPRVVNPAGYVIGQVVGIGR